MAKRALLIAGGGTLGNYVAETLLSEGHFVDVICLEERHPHHERVRFFQARATVDYLREFLKDRRYDAIVNFLHFTRAESYAPFHELLTAHADQLVVLSSYRVYADLEHPVTEEAPLLCDVVKDEALLAHETYAMGKCRCEAYVRHGSPAKNWTVVRPVISFADRRFDLIMHSGQTVLEAAKSGRELPLPAPCRDLVAGLDWAGNSGRLIAGLLFRPECLGETYTIGSEQNLTWGQVAELYAEHIGLRYRWLPLEEYLAQYPERERLLYDRMYDRDMDCTKVFNATGLRREDFTPLGEALGRELDKLKNEI